MEIHTNIVEKLDYFYTSKKIPHIIFHGSSGSGKRTLVNGFLNKIYNADKQKLKSNVMTVNCAHGKGIKFIREELKFFAKSNLQSNTGVTFKTIVLLNADSLTIDAQSALRRCIELFSYNTRFFIIVENKQKLLNPILSRFCEIYVPEPMVDGKILNLHQYAIQKTYQISMGADNIRWITEKMNELLQKQNIQHTDLTTLATEFYERGLSAMDVIQWLDTAEPEKLSGIDSTTVSMCYDKIKSEYRCEKLLIFYLFDLMFLRKNKNIAESVSF
jgi:DNA polymerase III delta prime subunit